MEAASENSLIDLSNNEIEIRIKLVLIREKPKSQFSSAYFTETLFFYIHLRVLFQNKHATLAENGKNLISAQPRVSAHSHGPKIK